MTGNFRKTGCKDKCRKISGVHLSKKREPAAAAAGSP